MHERLLCSIPGKRWGDKPAQVYLALAAQFRKGSTFQEDLETVCRWFPRIRERLKQSAGTLSGGEQGMVAIGRGMMGKPKLLLLDEPSLGLAPVVVDEFIRAIKTINEQGVTILLIEQNARKALSIASKGYVLQKGEIVLQGTRNDLYESALVQKAYL